jgi:hypothetical protein
LYQLKSSSLTAGPVKRSGIFLGYIEMKRILILAFLIIFPQLTLAQAPTKLCVNIDGISGHCLDVSVSNPLPVIVGSNSPTTTIITGNAQGTTGAVVGTLAAATGKTTYICGFHVDAIGGTASIGPLTLAGIVGSSMVFQGSSTATGNAGIPLMTFTPCLPASAQNTAITITTTADGTATAVDVNSWGFQQ